MSSTRTPLRLAILTLLTTILAACGGSTTEQMSASRPTQGLASSVTRPVATNAPATTNTPAATKTPEPTTEPLKDLVVKSNGFGQDGKGLGYGVVIENPNTSAALEGASLQIVAYDEADTVLGTEEATIPLVPPSTTIHFGGSTYIDTESPVKRIETQITDMGNPQKATTDEIPPFPSEAITFHESSFSKTVSGIIGNPFTVPLENLYVGVVAFDDKDQIVGGGFTFLDFLLPEGKSPFSTSVTVNGTPTHFEVSPILSSLTVWSQRDAKNLPPLKLVEQGWGQAGSQIGYGIVVENPDTMKALDGSQYIIAAYAKDGSVLAVESSYFGLILPGSKAVQANTLYLGGDDVTPDRVEAIILPGSLKEADGKLSFTTNGVKFVPGDYSSKATGQVINPYDKKVKGVHVSAILRDAAGKIIGGGLGYTETIPAKGKAAIEMSVTVRGEVATTELYADESGSTSIGD